MSAPGCIPLGVYKAYPHSPEGTWDLGYTSPEGTWDQGYTPCEQMYASENITFPQLRWRAVVKSLCCVLGDADALEITLKSKGKKGDNFNIPVQNKIV